jgi:1-deoxy-D-xylulose-5-phosphate synthase
MQDLPVTFCIDRAGVVGADGTTHTGAFDIVYLRMLPNMTILAPSDEAELARALRTAQAATGPVAIRYPRGSARGVEIPDEPQPFEQAASRTLRVGDDVCLIAVGSMVADAERAADLLAADGISAEVIDARYVKPVDTAMVDRAASRFPLVVTLEEGAVAGGFGSAVLEHLNARGMQTPVLQLGLPDSFVTHGSPSQIKEMLGLDADGIASSVRKRLGGE